MEEYKFICKTDVGTPCNLGPCTAIIRRKNTKPVGCLLVPSVNVPKWELIESSIPIEEPGCNAESAVENESSLDRIRKFMRDYPEDGENAPLIEELGRRFTSNELAEFIVELWTCGDTVAGFIL